MTTEDEARMVEIRNIYHAHETCSRCECDTCTAIRLLDVANVQLAAWKSWHANLEKENTRLDRQIQELRAEMIDAETEREMSDYYEP